MSIHIQATYRDGVIYPQQPLDLANDTLVDVSLTPIEVTPLPEATSDLETRPPAPRITPEKFREIVEKNAVSVGTLPVDFSRADIYQDHD